MPAESTFDIVSDYDQQELVNAVDQTRREVTTRYDLKDTKTELELSPTELVISTSDEMSLRAVRDILESKTLRRNLSLKIFDYGKVEEVGGMRVKQVITLKKGLDSDMAKRIQKIIRGAFPKVQPRIQGDTLRVGSKSRDELQAIIQLLKEREDEIPVPLQYTNYR